MPPGFGNAPIQTTIKQYCQVTGYVAPQNKFEMRLPLPADWNQRFLFALRRSLRRRRALTANLSVSGAGALFRQRRPEAGGQFRAARSHSNVRSGKLTEGPSAMR